MVEYNGFLAFFCSARAHRFWRFRPCALGAHPAALPAHVSQRLPVIISMFWPHLFPAFYEVIGTGGMLSKIFSGASRGLVETAKILTLKILSNAPRWPRGRFGCPNAGLLLLNFLVLVFRGFSFSDVPKLSQKSRKSSQFSGFRNVLIPSSGFAHI